MLVIIGLIISIPVVVWGSTLFIKLVDRFHWILYVGGGVLAFTAAKMITSEHARGLNLKAFFDSHRMLYWPFIGIVIIGVLLSGYLINRAKSRKQSATNS